MDSQIRLDPRTCYLQQILSIQDLLDIDNNMSPYWLSYCIYTFYCFNILIVLIVQDTLLFHTLFVLWTAIVFQLQPVLLLSFCTHLIVLCSTIGSVGISRVPCTPWSTSSFYLTGVLAITLLLHQIHIHCTLHTHTSDVSISSQPVAVHHVPCPKNLQ